MFRDKDRGDEDIALGSLHHGLAALDGKWLICLDNKDDPSANGIVGELAKNARHVCVIVGFLEIHVKAASRCGKA